MVATSGTCRFTVTWLSVACIHNSSDISYIIWANGYSLTSEWSFSSVSKPNSSIWEAASLARRYAIAAIAMPAATIAMYQRQDQVGNRKNPGIYAAKLLVLGLLI